MSRPRFSSRLAGFGTSVFAEMTDLANLHGAVNLGQGYPDFDGPAFVKEAAAAAIAAGHNQYAPMPGLPALRRAVAEHQRRFYGLDFVPEAEVTIHAGATETIAATCLRHDLLAVSDEVYEHIVFEGAHVPIATLPGMRERSVTISSSGKSFSATGWKIGWSCAAPARGGASIRCRSRWRWLRAGSRCGPHRALPRRETTVAGCYVSSITGLRGPAGGSPS